jgi:5-methylcytosine-specific restriction endonuclease McrA
VEIILLDEAREKGLTRYFTGKPCPQGHVCERMVSNRDCLGCLQGRSKLYYAENGDEIRAKARVRMGRLYKQDPQRFRDRKRATYYSDPEYWRADTRRYNAEHPLKVRAGNSVSSRKFAEGSFTEDDILAKFASQSARCNGCGADLSAAWQIDHIVPTSRGGTHWPDNIQLLCPFCNSSKHDKTMEEWLATRRPNARFKAA